MNTNLSIIIVSYNTKPYTLKAVEAVYRTLRLLHYEIIVVENNSQDGTYEALRKKFPKVVVLATKETMGFGAASNLGAKRAKGKVLLFLNPDTEVQEGAIDCLFSDLSQGNARRVISGKLLNSDGTIQQQGGALPNLFIIAAWMFFIDDLPIVGRFFAAYQQKNTARFTTPRTLGWIGGTALMMTKDFFDELGGWNGNIFLYGEDVELCLRVHRVGGEVTLIPQATIIHHQHKSGSIERARLGEMQGLLYIWKKHFPAWQMPLLKFLLFCGSLLRVLIFGILLGHAEHKRIYLHIIKNLSMA